MSYASFHNHSEYSFQDGYATPKEYLDRARKIGLKGFAISEHGNQCSWVYFDKIKKDYPEIKMVYGIEFYQEGLGEDRYYHLLALAKDEEGRKILNKIQRLSKDNFYYKPRVSLDMFRDEDCSHLIVGSGCLAGILAKHMSDPKRCIEFVREYKSIFPNFYLEMQSHYSQDQVNYNKFLLKLSKETNTPFIITTDSHYTLKKDSIYQARHVQIAHDSETLSESYEDCYLQTEDEIHECMDSQIGADNVKWALLNTLDILDTIDEVNMPWQDAKLPHFPIPNEFNNEYDYLEHLVLNVGWFDKKIDEKSTDEQSQYKERVLYELDVIKNMGFSGYFLIEWEWVYWGKRNNVAIGVGRGSSISSLVNYLLNITEVDPIKYGLIFERFLNPSRRDYPDIDTDVNDKQSIVKHLGDVYGRDKVAQVCNLNYITPTVAIRDVCKVFGISFSLTEKINKSFTARTWKECIELNPEVLETYAEYQEMFDVASHLSGRVRGFGIHAGGVVISRTSLDDYIGISKGGDNEDVINLDKKQCQPLGLIKYDILGLSNLSVIQETKNDLHLDDWELDINNPKFEFDKETFEVIKKCKTDAIFQMESTRMKELIKRIQPNSLQELSDISAISRPDASSMIEDYIQRRDGVQEVTYWHPDLEEALGETYGTILYQEQTMEVVRKLGGRDYVGADKFRKITASKQKDKAELESQILYNEIVENGYDTEVAEKVKNFLAESGSYSFNKSHSIGYSVITMQTAYLKVHYPLYFFKALLNQNKGDYGNINKYIIDAKDFGVEVVEPNINKSDRFFSVANGKILFGLSAIKGVGEKVVDGIMEERDKAKFKNFNDLIERVRLSKSQIVALIKSGAIPCKDKRQLLITYGQSLFETKEYKPVSTFTLSLQKAYDKYGIDFKPMSKEDRLDKLNEFKKIEFDIAKKKQYYDSVKNFQEKYMEDEKFWEFETLSIFLKDNPFTEALEYLTPVDEVGDGNSFIIVGVISNIQKKKDRNKRDYGYISLYSSNGLMEITCWSSQYKTYQDLIKKGSQVAILGRKREENYQVKEIKTYHKWLEDSNLKHLM